MAMFGRDKNDHNDGSTVQPTDPAYEPAAQVASDTITPQATDAPAIDDNAGQGAPVLDDNGSDFIMTAPAGTAPTPVEPVTPPAPAASEPGLNLPAPSAPPASEPAVATALPDDLQSIKQQALQQLSPLVDHLEQSAEDKFRTTMMMLQATDDQSLIKVAYEAAQNIKDDKARAQALLDVVNEINYFTQQKS